MIKSSRVKWIGAQSKTWEKKDIQGFGGETIKK
jgi:hypothetical protein